MEGRANTASDAEPESDGKVPVIKPDGTNILAQVHDLEAREGFVVALLVVGLEQLRLIVQVDEVLFIHADSCREQGEGEAEGSDKRKDA